MNILSLDIGSSQIKCIVVETKWKRFDIVYHDILRVSDALDERVATEELELLSPGQIHALAEIQRRYTHNIDRLVINIPLSLYSTRMMHFPFKDKKKISAAVNFQIEDEIPFDVDDCIVTSHVFPTKTKETDVIAGIAPVETLQKYIETLQKVGLDPDVLLAEEPAYASLLGHQKNTLPNQAIAIVNFGHRKSSISIFKDGMPAMYRTSMNGGLNITKAIAKKYEVSLAEAEVAKLDKAFIATPGMQITAEQQLFSDVIAGALDPVLHDFDQALMAYASRNNQRVDTIYVSGGTALLPGFIEVLNLRWNRKVLPFDVLAKIPHVSIRPQKSTELVLPPAISFGISQVRSEHRSAINFRAGALRRQHSAININWQEFVGPLKLAFVVYVFAVISLSFQFLFLKRDFAQLEAKQESAIKSILAPPTSSALQQLKGNPVRLKQSVDKKVAELQAQVHDNGPAGASSVLELIQILSRSVSRSAVVEVREFNLQGRELSLKLSSPTQKDAEAAVKAFSSVPGFAAPKASPIEASGTRKKFSMSLQVPGGGL